MLYLTFVLPKLVILLLSIFLNFFLCFCFSILDAFCTICVQACKLVSAVRGWAVDGSRRQ